MSVTASFPMPKSLLYRARSTQGDRGCEIYPVTLQAVFNVKLVKPSKGRSHWQFTQREILGHARPGYFADFRIIANAGSRPISIQKFCGQKAYDGQQLDYSKAFESGEPGD